MSIDEADPASMDRLEFARLVKRSTAADLQRLLAGERRSVILDGIVFAMPEVFRADVAGRLRAVVHWVVGGRADGGSDVYELVIADGACTVSPRPESKPQLTLTVSAVDFLRMTTGNTHPVMLVMSGRLKTKGELGLTAKFPTLFATPQP
jgi:putative sterol carrier protein